MDARRWASAFVILLIGPAGRADDRPAVERALAYLESDGVAWMTERGCASCHHVPFLIWSHNEARSRGFAIDGKKVEAWTNWALADTLARDKDDEGGGLETIAQLLLGRDRSSAWRLKPTRHHRTVDPYETLWGLLLDKQKPEGSFPSEGQRAFPEDISTGWALLALASRDSIKAPKDAKEGRRDHALGPDMTARLQKLDMRIPAAQERALAWLRSAKPDASTEAAVLRMLVASKHGDPGQAETRRMELITRQRPDGGWAYRYAGDRSDAFATGLALFALNVAGTKSDDPVVVAARQFLLTTQKPNGTWLVLSRSIHDQELKDDYRVRTDEIYTYWGTAWATIGLLHALPGGPPRNR